METFIIEIFNIFLHIESLEPSMYYTYSMAHVGLTTYLKAHEANGYYIMHVILYISLWFTSAPSPSFPYLNPASPTQLQLLDFPEGWPLSSKPTLCPGLNFIPPVQDLGLHS